MQITLPVNFTLFLHTRGSLTRMMSLPCRHGIAVDGPNDLVLRALISDFAAAGKLVSAVCHGPVSFSGPTINGKPIVAGKKA
jgi:hypothetical protein